jgi:hypothetical protein
MARHHRRGRRLLVAGAVALIASSTTGAVAYADGSPTVAITAGSLTFTAPVPGNFASVTLSGVAQSTTATIPAYTVDDATGSGSGWNVSVAATQFCQQGTGSTCATSPKLIPTGSLTLSAPTATASGTSSAVPTTLTLTGVDGTSGKQVSAAVGAGMGTFSIGTSTATLSIPANTYADTYVSTLTYTLATSP